MKKIFLILICFLLFLSCVKKNISKKKGYFPPPNITISLSKATKEEQEVSLKKEEKKSPSITQVPVILSKKKGEKIAQILLPKSTLLQKIKLSVENMPLIDFIHLTFGKILKLNYTVDTSVEQRKEPITLRIEKEISSLQFFKIITTILMDYGIRLKKKDNLIFISAEKEIENTISLFFVGRNIPENIPSETIVALITDLNYIKASNYRTLLKRLCLSPEGKAELLPGTNAIVIVDKVDYVRAASKLINLFDTPAFSSKKAVLISLDYISAKDFVEHLRKVLPSEGIPISTKPTEPGITLIPVEELNSILVVYSQKKWINIVYFWKKKFDNPSVLGNQPRFFIFYPKNRRAQDLADIFSKLDFLTSKHKEKEDKNLPFFTEKGKTKQKESKKLSIYKGVQILVDPKRNALIIYATPSEYQKIKDVLKKLDTLPKQVLCEVTVAEVTLSGELQYGVEWYLKHSGKLTGEIQTLGNLGIGNRGLTYSVISDTKKFQAIINAFAQKNLINILSSPRLIVLDNQEAYINVGMEVPIVTTESTAPDIQAQGTSSILRSIQYRSTGVILHIKPTINSGGILTLNIRQEVSEAQTNTISPEIASPLILTREINTSVVLKSGMTLFIGGLIKSNKSKIVNKVPILGDIPLLGYLFRTHSETTIKTELIIQITPYILSNMSEAKQVTERLKSLFKWFCK